MLQQAVSAAGRVTDERGIGIANATVSVRYLDIRPRSLLINQEIGEIQSDDYGYFRLPAVAKGKSFVVDAVSDGHPFSSSKVCSVSKDEAVQPPLCNVRVMGQARSLTGRVINRDGKEAKGVRISIRATADHEPLDSGQRASLAFLKFSSRSGKTDENGRFSFAAVPAGNVQIIAGEGVSITHEKVLVLANGDSAPIEMRLP